MVIPITSPNEEFVMEGFQWTQHKWFPVSLFFADTKVEPASVSELKEQKVGFCYVVAKVLLNIIVICY